MELREKMLRSRGLTRPVKSSPGADEAKYFPRSIAAVGPTGAADEKP
jgi:hypothetical protein